MLIAALLVAALESPPPDLTAVGVVQSAQAERSVAVLRSGGRTRIAAVGETAFGGIVTAVSPTSVTLEFGSGRVELRLQGGAAPTAGAPARPKTPAALRPFDAPEDPATPSRVMSRREVERRLAAETSRLLLETTLVPVFEEGQVNGFMLTRLPDSSLLTDVGLRVGDTLSRINDVQIDSLATLMGLWPKLQTESILRAEVIRNGHPITLAVTLQ